jgi:hypothetical protein
MMLGGDKAFVEFRHINRLDKAVWIEENGRKIFDPEIFKIRRGEKIVFYINAPMGNGIINLNGKEIFKKGGNVSFEFPVKKNILITAEKKTYSSEYGFMITDYVIEITER